MDFPHEPDAPVSPRGPLAKAEDLLCGLVLAALVLVPLAGIFCRDLAPRLGLHLSFEGAEAFVQHLTLLVGICGGALAARERRLIALAAAETFLRGRIREIAHLLAGALGASICFWLAVSAVQLGMSEDPEKTIAYGIRVRWFEFALAPGVGLIGLRLLLLVSPLWSLRSLAAALAALLIGLEGWWVAPESLLWPGVAALAAGTLLGLPIFAVLGGAALLLFHVHDTPIASVAANQYGLIINQTLPALPLFTFAGYCLAEGGASRRLIRVFQALFGSFSGGPAIVTVCACAFFTAFTGGSGVTVLALAALLMPVLLDAGYKERGALGLLTGAGSLGMLFPPCLPVILYVIVVNNQKIPGLAPLAIRDMFAGGLLPGLVLMGVTAAWGVWAGGRDIASRRRFDAREAAAALWIAKWDLLVPVVAIVGIFGGFAGMIEAAALTAFYAFFVETFLYRDLKLGRDVPRALAECGTLIGGVLLIVGVAYALTNYFVDAQIPDLAAEWAFASLHSPWIFLLVLNLALLLIGCLVDTYSAIILFAPIIVPIGLKFGIDPVHLGIIFLANLELGFLTPPVGLNLFLASMRFRKSILEVSRAILPLLAVQGVGVLLITYIPALTTWLPRALGWTVAPP